MSTKSSQTMSVVSLFSGIGGIESGLKSAGHETKFFCELDPAAKAVLRSHFPGITLRSDITELRSIPDCDLVAAGFPCQDLSQAGRTKGIKGKNSGLVQDVFRLISKKRRKPNWLLIENVPNMLWLDGGRAMRYLVRNLEELGYRWAYRVVDARAFGLPQRRRRVILLASLNDDPREVLFADDAGSPYDNERPIEVNERRMYGFYWTEGTRGIGWAIDSIPPIKGGSGIGIPSPPAVWDPRLDFVGTPDIRDAERLQGFPENWTYPAVDFGYRERIRWKLVGNAVCTKVAEWVGDRLNDPGYYKENRRLEIIDSIWPSAAWGQECRAYVEPVTEWPARPRSLRISKFLNYPLHDLSAKATSGFLSRASSESCNITFSPRFLSSLEIYLTKLG